MASDHEIQSFLRDHMETGKDYTIAEIISQAANAASVEPFRVAKNLCALESRGELTFRNPNRPMSFVGYLKSYDESSSWFWGIVALVVLTISFVYLIPMNNGTMYLRYALGIMFMAFLPGYAVTEALYPSKKDLTFLERSALYVGLSLTFVPLVALLLNYTPLHITLNSMILTLSEMTLVLAILAAVRKFETEVSGRK